MKKICIISLLFCSMLCTCVTFVFAKDDNSKAPQFFEEVNKKTYLENTNHFLLLENNIYNNNGHFYILNYQIEKEGKLIRFLDTKEYLYLLYFDDVYYLEQLSTETKKSKIITFNQKINDIAVTNNAIYLVGMSNEDAIIYRYDLELNLYNMYTFGGTRYEEFIKIAKIDNFIYLFGYKSGISHNSILSNVGNTEDIKPFIIQIDESYKIFASYYINEHTAYETFQSIIIHDKSMYFLVKTQDQNYYQYSLDSMLNTKERYQVPSDFMFEELYLVDSYKIEKQKVYIYQKNKTLYYGIYTNQFVHEYMIDTLVDKINQVFINQGNLEIYTKMNHDIVKYQVSMYYINKLQAKTISQNDDTYLDTDHFDVQSYFEPLEFSYDYENNHDILLNIANDYVATYVATKEDGKKIYIETPYHVLPYLNIINQGIYPKGYKLIFSDELYLNEEKVYNGETLLNSGENQIIHKVKGKSLTYTIYVYDTYYKDFFVNAKDTNITLNQGDRYIYHLDLSFYKEVKDIVVNGEKFPFRQIENTLILEFIASEYGIKTYQIELINFNDNSCYLIGEKLTIKTKKQLPILDIYYQDNSIEYSIIDSDSSINDILVKYYLENTLMKVDRLYLEDKTISLLKNTDQIEVVLQYEDGTKNLYEEKLFAIHATTKKKSEAIFHINIEVSKGKVSQILLEDFDMKKVDLSSAYVENLAFTSAITPQQNSIMFYISFISTGVIIIICTVILIIKKNQISKIKS